MQLGTRWSIGAEPPARIPDAIRVAVRTVETELAQTEQSVDGWGWTLTYLEGAPIVDLDDGTRIRLTDDDVALITAADLDGADED